MVTFWELNTNLIVATLSFTDDLPFTLCYKVSVIVLLDGTWHIEVGSFIQSNTNFVLVHRLYCYIFGVPIHSLETSVLQLSACRRV